jgi:hypothetical protein
MCHAAARDTYSKTPGRRAPSHASWRDTERAPTSRSMRWRWRWRWRRSRPRTSCGASRPCSRSPPSAGRHWPPRRAVDRVVGGVGRGGRRRADAARHAAAAAARSECRRDRSAARRRMRVARHERRPSRRAGRAQPQGRRGRAPAVDTGVHARRPAAHPTSLLPSMSIHASATVRCQLACLT